MEIATGRVYGGHDMVLCEGHGLSSVLAVTFAEDIVESW